MIRISLLASLLALAGCNGTSAPDPYVELADGMWITFVDNPEIGDGACNPIIEAAYRSEGPPIAIQVSMRVNSESSPAATVTLEPSSTPGLLIGRGPMSANAAFDGACKDMNLWLLQLKCTDPDGTEYVDCPSLGRTDGLRMFGSVRVSF